ncbi:hypothetical protein Gpo141_00009460 [Globisporangium polare]
MHNTAMTSELSSADAHAAQSLAQALRVGVLTFLSVRDVVVLLTASCKSFRCDRELLQATLLDSPPAAQHGRHLLQTCCSDWFSLVPKRIVGDEELTSVCCDLTHYEDDDPGRYMKIKDPVRDSNSSNNKTGARHPDSYYAQLLSLVGVFDKFVVPTCRDREIYLSSYGDRTATIPMAISLWDYYQPASREDGGNVWTRDNVRQALNAVRAGLGDRFTDEGRESAHVSQFGAHWDSIRVTQGAEDGKSGETVCELCEMRTSVVRDFKEQVEKRQLEREAASQRARNSWGYDADTDEEDSAGLAAFRFLQDLVAPDGDEFFLSDNAYLHGEVENPLEHITNQQQVQFPPFLPGKGLSPEDLFECLQDIYGYPVQCRTMSQPLKRLLVKHCLFTNRIKYDWIPLQAFATSHAFRCSKIELVGGVLPSGFFCGAFVAILETL